MNNTWVVTFWLWTLTPTRFQLILRYLNLADNALHIPRDQSGYNSLFKMRPVLDHLLTKIHPLHTPFANLIVSHPEKNLMGWFLDDIWPVYSDICGTDVCVEIGMWIEDEQQLHCISSSCGEMSIIIKQQTLYEDGRQWRNQINLREKEIKID